MLPVYSLSALAVHPEEIAGYCLQTEEPVFITHPGGGELVLLSAETYEKQCEGPGVDSQTREAGYFARSGPVRERLFLAAAQLRECLTDPA